ncbi:MAG: hypothetical protein GY696_05350 [Gammaproteobacteria bacterium]|nr:hypothetical protein [Gammaproteobacteria bacterium]
MTLIAAQRKAIKDGLAFDTCMDGLSSTTPYHQGSRGAPRTEMAKTYSAQPARAYAPWVAPEPARPQNQWGCRHLLGFRASGGQVGLMQSRLCPLPP